MQVERGGLQVKGFGLSCVQKGVECLELISEEICFFFFFNESLVQEENCFGLIWLINSCSINLVY